GFADRHQQPDHERRRAERADQPGQHEPRIEQAVGSAARGKAHEVREEVARLFVTARLGDVEADALRLVADEDFVETLARGAGRNAGHSTTGTGGRSKSEGNQRPADPAAYPRGEIPAARRG